VGAADGGAPPLAADSGTEATDASEGADAAIGDGAAAEPDSAVSDASGDGADALDAMREAAHDDGGCDASDCGPPGDVEGDR
jgi:hypothetical protein